MFTNICCFMRFTSEHRAARRRGGAALRGSVSTAQTCGSARRPGTCPRQWGGGEGRGQAVSRVESSSIAPQQGFELLRRLMSPAPKKGTNHVPACISVRIPAQIGSNRPQRAGIPPEAERGIHDVSESSSAWDFKSLRGSPLCPMVSASPSPQTPPSASRRESQAMRDCSKNSASIVGVQRMDPPVKSRHPSTLAPHECT